MDLPSKPEPQRDHLIERMSMDRRISVYKECCYRSYAAGLASLAVVTSVTYFTLKRIPIRNTTRILLSGCFGSLGGYFVSKEKSKECNAILKAHRESMKNPVSA